MAGALRFEHQHRAGLAARRAVREIARRTKAEERVVGADALAPGRERRGTCRDMFWKALRARCAKRSACGWRSRAAGRSIQSPDMNSTRAAGGTKSWLALREIGGAFGGSFGRHGSTKIRLSARWVMPEPSPQPTDTLANERTYLAYVRTALAFIAFGFVIARFSLFAREFSDARSSTRMPRPACRPAFGTAMALFGILVALLGAWRYARTDRGLREGRVSTLSGLAGYLISLFVVAIGAVVAFALVSYR